MDTNLQKFMAFVSTAENGSFTKAAQMLHYSQSGISRMIRDLEEEWNVVLLERGKGGVKLTSDGTKLLPYAQGVCSEYKKLQMEVDSLNGLQSGLIRIGSFSSAATHWLPKIVSAFQRDYPNVEFEFVQGRYSEVEDWIGSGRVDCGFLRLPTRPDFETIFLEEDPLMAVIPENHPLKDLEKFPVDSINGEPFIMLERDTREDISNTLQQRGIYPRVRFTTRDGHAAMSMVEAGLGISVLSNLFLKRNPYRVLIRELDVPTSRKIGLALRSTKTASLAVKRFLDYLDCRL